MKKFIVTIEDDVCLRNNKTEVMQADLVRKIAEYGTVEEYSSHVAKLDVEWQKKLDNMTAQYNQVAEYGARNETELEVLRAHRVGVEKSVQASEAKCAVMEGKLKETEQKATAMANAVRTTLEAYSNE